MEAEIIRLSDNDKIFKIKIEIDGKKFVISERHGKLHLYGEDTLIIHPCVSNVIDISQKER